MHIVCWTLKATNTHSENVIFITVPPQQWLHERASVLLYTHIACLVNFRTIHTTLLSSANRYSNCTNSAVVWKTRNGALATVT